MREQALGPPDFNQHGQVTKLVDIPAPGEWDSGYRYFQLKKKVYLWSSSFLLLRCSLYLSAIEITYLS